MRPAIFIQPGANSRSIFLDMARGWHDAGLEPLVVDLSAVWAGLSGAPDSERIERSAAFTRDVVNLVRSQGVTHAIGMWANLLRMLAHPRGAEGTVRSIISELGITHLAWWLDAPHWAHAGEARGLANHPILRENAIINLINNPGTAEEMIDVLGFANTRVFPLAIDPRVHTPHADVSPEFDLVISCGPGDPEPTPLALDELANDDPDVPALRAEAAERIRGKLRKVAARFPGHESMMEAFLAELLASQLASRDMPLLARARAIATRDATHAAALAMLVDRPSEWIDATMNIRRVEAWERAFTIAWLSRRFRVATFGPSGTRTWPNAAHDLGELPYREMSRAYARGHAALNVMRWQDDVGLNLKPFEITASGVACLCGTRVGLESMFEVGKEVLRVDGPADIARQLRGLLDVPEHRRSLAGAGHARTVRDHTWAARVRSLIPMLA